MRNTINDSRSHATTAISRPTITRLAVTRRRGPVAASAAVAPVVGRDLELVLLAAQPRLQTARSGAVELVRGLFEVAGHVPI